MMLDANTRRRRDELKAELRRLEDPGREAKKIAEASRRAQREFGRRPRIDHKRTKPKGGHEADAGFMSWLHDSELTCVACEIEGPPTADQLKGEPNPMEVAHQRVDGWKKGVKGHDRNSCILCRWHHQLAPNACDKGQRQFWARLRVEASDFVTALHQAYRSGNDGQVVIVRFIAGRTM
ncbi:hypothetical protein [Phenylobacterium sp.]|uniref:hypothetical protein n=1 Tax=Phenylobacterium sp. TaxID=1871053 RepID=UPI0027315A63|nr:hypothetical protein [Phenylobacterium sp.]MDP1598976.1 hypothetical protein [Phenylobacterium sp.]MDP3590403.1 hypothetical protein [Phenylobacterium sp.]